MKFIQERLSSVILAVVAIALIVGVILCFATPIGNAISGILRKESQVEIGDNIWEQGNYEISYTVTLKTNLSDAGNVSFTGEHDGETSVSLCGDQTLTFTATANDGFIFLGWYAGDILISEDAEFLAGYAVNKDSTITAVFEAFVLPGLYQTGSALYNNSTMLKSWNELISDGILDSDGKIVPGQEANLAGDLVLPDTLSSIANYAFKNCTNLTSITIPDSVQSIGSYAFQGCTNLKTAYYECTLEEYCKIDFSPTTTSNPCHNGAALYIGGDLVESIVIPSSITSINQYAFYNCTSLTAVTLPDEVTSIGDYAFANCANLSTVNLSNNSQLESIGASAFAGCASLTSIAVPAGVASGGNSPYAFRSSTMGVIIPDGVTAIGSRAFENCTSLEVVIFGDNSELKSIQSYTFSGCSSLENIEIPASVTVINKGAFKDCKGLETVTFGDNSQLTTIGNEAFSECISLESIEIPDSVTSVGSLAFDGCPNVTDYVGNVQYVDTWVIDCDTSGTDVILRDGTRGIAGTAFSGCANLTDVTIPDGVTTIGASAFFMCKNLNSIVIPNTVSSIGGSAFNNCKGLTTITFEGTVAQWNAISKGANWNLYVPAAFITCSDGTIML